MLLSSGRNLLLEAVLNSYRKFFEVILSEFIGFMGFVSKV